MLTYQKPYVRTSELEFISQLQNYLDCRTDISCFGSPAPFGAECDGVSNEAVAAATFTGSFTPTNCTIEVNGVEATNCDTNVDSTNCSAFAVRVFCDPANVPCGAPGTNEFVLRCDGFADADCEFESDKL